MQKFLFETQFDPESGFAAGPAAGPSQAPPAAPPSYGEEDLKQAREDGLAAGRSAGVADAMRTTEQALAAACAAIVEQLDELTARLEATVEQRERETLRTAVLIVRKLFPQLARRHALAEAEAVVAQCLEHLRDEPRVVVRTPDALLDPLTRRLTGLAEGYGFEGKLIVLADPDLGSSDVRVEWADGGAERDTGRLWREVDEILGRALGTGPRAPTKQRDAADLLRPSVPKVVPAAIPEATPAASTEPTVLAQPA